MFRKILGITAAAVIALGMLTVGPVPAAQASAPCAVPGEGPRDGSGQGRGMKQGRGRMLRDGSCIDRGLQPGGGKTINQ